MNTANRAPTDLYPCNQDHGAPTNMHFSPRKSVYCAVDVSNEEKLTMKSMKPANKSDRSYTTTLREYYQRLQIDSGSDYSTARLLKELDNLLDRCAKVQSPQREAMFVDEVCRMGRRLNLAA